MANVGTLRLRDPVTKRRIGILRVSRVEADELVTVEIDMGPPVVELEVSFDVANALADLLMDATAPNK